MESGVRGGLGLRELRTMSYRTLVMQIVESEIVFCSALIGACDCVGLCVLTQHVACTYPLIV